MSAKVSLSTATARTLVARYRRKGVSRTLWAQFLNSLGYRTVSGQMLVTQDVEKLVVGELEVVQ